ncbi:nucleolin 1-like isoform X3 [Senna tora]|uniref:Nucleolin 1-like isoform X3 n=1 Tax=Senna tora TaxID=362788 RepID=A0A834SRI9_9FABA|nr:nucleolin 1-like isoform X3 [Senna tora]
MCNFFEDIIGSEAIFLWFAWVDFEDVDGFNKALELDGTKVGGYTLLVEAKRPRRYNQGGRDGSGHFGGWRGGDRWGQERGGSGWSCSFELNLPCSIPIVWPSEYHMISIAATYYLSSSFADDLSCCQ